PNMTFYHCLMIELRGSILRDDFLSYYEQKRAELAAIDERDPCRPAKKAQTSRPARLGDYEIHTSPRGFSSLRQISSGEVMHSVNASVDEGNRLYVEQSFLAVRLLKCEAPADELVIWDVGLGAAFNVMAAIRCFERCYGEKGETALRPLRLVSFEWDLDPLTLAVKNPA